jgi:surfactin synthase thioesterase subunit
LPTAVFGHSLGSLVGFALCRALADTSPPCRLIVAGGRAPHLPARRSLSNLPLATLLEELLKIGGTSPLALAEAELVALVEPALRADFKLAETNALPVTPRLRIPITVFGGTDDLQVRASELEAWRELTVEACTLDYLPGGHFFARDNPPELVRRIGLLLPA